ncbi:hypothetical protein TNCV_4512151 [Trichonephila clavipes]|nr:hypothetical protein TNCV_4512151 [Trichonephila clavipes]
MQWPGYSPVLNHSGYAWDALHRQVAQRTIHLCTVQALKITLKEDWNNIPQGFLDSLGKNMLKNVHYSVPGQQHLIKILMSALF